MNSQAFNCCSMGPQRSLRLKKVSSPPNEILGPCTCLAPPKQPNPKKKPFFYIYGVTTAYLCPLTP